MHEAGGHRTLGPEAEPGWWQLCWRDLELGVLMELAWSKHATGAAGAEMCVHGARMVLPLCLPCPEPDSTTARCIPHQTPVGLPGLH